MDRNNREPAVAHALRIPVNERPMALFGATGMGPIFIDGTSLHTVSDIAAHILSVNESISMIIARYYVDTSKPGPTVVRRHPRPEVNSNVQNIRLSPAKPSRSEACVRGIHRDSVTIETDASVKTLGRCSGEA